MKVASLSMLVGVVHAQLYSSARSGFPFIGYQAPASAPVSPYGGAYSPYGSKPVSRGPYGGVYSPYGAGMPRSGALLDQASVYYQASSRLHQRADALHGVATMLPTHQLPRALAIEQTSIVLGGMAAELEVASAVTVDEAVLDEDANGLPCCDDMLSAHCASCNMGLSLEEYCAEEGVRPLPGCGFGAAQGQCGVGIPSRDGAVCCDPDECGGVCGGKGCASRHGGPARCCATAINVVGEGCDDHNPPCSRGAGHSSGLRGLYLYEPEETEEATEELSVIIAGDDPEYYDDGTLIVSDGGCGYYPSCGACAKAAEGCTWDAGKCVMWKGESTCAR